MKPFYWIVSVALIAFAAAGSIVLFDPPRVAEVDARIFEQFFRTQNIVALLTGLAGGVLFGLIAVRRTYHEPKERGVDFAARVIWKGFFAGLLTALIMAVIALALASQNEMGPLAPMERVITVLGNGLYYVTLAIAAGSAMFAYLVVTRLSRWGGQYALV